MMNFLSMFAGGGGGYSSSAKSGGGDTNQDFWNDLQGGDAVTGGKSGGDWMPYILAGGLLLIAYKVVK